jgi:hypothetical protein
VYHPSDKWRSGIGDEILSINSKFIMLEIKSKVGKVEPIQEATLEAVRKSGGTAGVVRSVKEAIELISSALHSEMSE